MLAGVEGFGAVLGGAESGWSQGSAWEAHGRCTRSFWMRWVRALAAEPTRHLLETTGQRFPLYLTWMRLGEAEAAMGAQDKMYEEIRHLAGAVCTP